jgi:hypothetical protein
MELNQVVYLSVAIIFIGTLGFGIFFYIISLKNRNKRRPYKIKIFDELIIDVSFSPPIRHLRRRKFYHTNFADTIEIKKQNKVKHKISQDNVGNTSEKHNHHRYSILNNSCFPSPETNLLENDSYSFNFKTIDN